MTAPPPPPPPGPIAQSVAIGFRSVYLAAGVLVLLWLSGNIREIAPDSQAVVRRFGSIVRTQESGLLAAWPRPIEEVQILPGPQQQLTQDVGALEPPTQQSQALIGPGAGGGGLPADESAYLTGDGNVVLLSATLIYRIDDPIAYALSQRHVVAALQRLFRASAVYVTAGRDLNQFLVVSHPGAVSSITTGAGGEASPGAAGVTALRAEVRDRLLEDINGRLQALARAGASLGVHIERVDMTAWLPPQAKSAFDEVLVAAQSADREVADARTDGERRRQGAAQLSEQLVASAQARAQELVSSAAVNTAGILALEREETPMTRSSLLLQQYRSRISEIMRRVGAVTLVDPKSGARFVMAGNRASPQAPPGANPAPESQP
ncbi:MAG: SPFH domain-containing protein [Steroidobacteraceae bacterium]